MQEFDGMDRAVTMQQCPYTGEIQGKRWRSGSFPGYAGRLRIARCLPVIGMRTMLSLEMFL